MGTEISVPTGECMGVDFEVVTNEGDHVPVASYAPDKSGRITVENDFIASRIAHTVGAGTGRTYAIPHGQPSHSCVCGREILDIFGEICWRCREGEVHG